MSNNVLITGASRGIGFEAARAFAKAGKADDVIILVARASAEFDERFRSLQAENNHIEFIKITADLSDVGSVDVIFDELDNRGIEVNVLVNNAGYTNPKSLNETQVGDFEYTLRVNLLSPFKMVQNAVVRGHPLQTIINVASTAGMNGRAGWLTYSASKAAMINMSEVLQDELRPYGVKVVCLSPGRCATDLRKILAPDEDPTTIMQASQLADVMQMMASPIGRLLDSRNVVVRI